MVHYRLVRLLVLALLTQYSVRAVGTSVSPSTPLLWEHSMALVSTRLMDAFDRRRSLCALWRFPVRLEAFVNFGGGYDHLQGKEVRTRACGTWSDCATRKFGSQMSCYLRRLLLYPLNLHHALFYYMRQQSFTRFTFTVSSIYWKIKLCQFHSAS